MIFGLVRTLSPALDNPVPRGTKIAEPESGGTDRTTIVRRAGEKFSGGGALTKHLPSGGTHVDIAPWEGAWELDAPNIWATEALSSYAESWDAREQTLGHMSGYLQGFLLSIKI